MFLTVSNAVADIEFVEPPPVAGPVTPYKSGSVMTEEENIRLGREQRENWDKLTDKITRVNDADRVREDELYRSTANERARSDQKVDDYADDNRIENTRLKVSTSIGADGTYEGHELLYYGRSGTVEFIAKFDGDGNVTSPVTQTPTGKAAQNARAHRPSHSTGLDEWLETQDQFGNTFPYRINFSHGGGYLLFNERGIAYQGETFDESGRRNGGFLDPSEYPFYADPDGALSPVSLASYATSTCTDCQKQVQKHNAIADEFNHISREMNQLAAEHNRIDAITRERNTAYDRNVIQMRARYAHLSGLREAKQTEGAAALNALVDCDRQCPGTENDQPYSAITGSPIAGPAPLASSPFTPLINTLDTAGNNATAAGQPATCPNTTLSVAADTIACSVHTRAKPNLGQTSDPNVVVTDTTEVPEEAGGGYDSEVKISRSPEDNNLRQGCGDLPSDLIEMGQNPAENGAGGNPDTNGNSGGNFGGFEVFKPVSCNQVAKGDDGAAPRARITFQDYAQAGTPEGFLIGKNWGRKGREDHPDVAASDARSAFKLMQGLACGPGTGGPALPKTRVRFSDDALPLSERINIGTVGKADIDSILDGVKVGRAGLDALTKLEYLKYKIDNGLEVTAEDIGDLADNLNTLRGDRFKELGKVLGGISTHAGNIKKAGKFLEQAGKIYKWIQLAEEGRNDPLKAAEAFSQYLGMLSKVAGEVPGMGEFVTKYAEAVASMQDDLKIISARTQLTNDIIRQVGAFRDEYPDLELDDFYDDIAEGSSDTPVDGKRETDLRNRDEKIADERDALDNARDSLRGIEDCIERNTAKIAAIERTLPELAKKWDKLPDQETLEDEIQNSVDRLTNRRRFERDGGYPRSGTRKFRGSKERWTRDELAEIAQTGPTAIEDAIRNAREGRANRERIIRKAKQLQEDYEAAMKALEDCGKRLQEAQKNYLQALRDYQGANAYWTTFIDNNYNPSIAEKARATALAAVDQQVTALGLGVINGEVRITVTTVCEEDGSVLSRETATQAASASDGEELSDEEFMQRFGAKVPEGLDGYEDQQDSSDLEEFEVP